MTRRTRLAVAFAALLTPLPALAQQQPAPAVQSTAAAPATQPTPADVQAITSADSPAAAQDAYARATAARPDGSIPDKIPADRAFLAKMVDLNLPEIAASQATELVRDDPHDDLAWAVVAHDKARHGEFTGALAAIVSATAPTDRHPLNPFTLRTAGSLLAWYDQNRAAIQLTPQARQSLEQMRTIYMADQTFRTAFNQAADAYARANTPAQPTPPGEEPTITPNYSVPNESANEAAAAPPVPTPAEPREWTYGNAVTTSPPSPYPYANPLNYTGTGVPYIESSPYIYSPEPEWQPAPWSGPSVYIYGGSSWNRWNHSDRFHSWNHEQDRHNYTHPNITHDWQHNGWNRDGSNHRQLDDGSNNHSAAQPWHAHDNNDSFHSAPHESHPYTPPASPAPNVEPTRPSDSGSHFSHSDGGGSHSGGGRH